MENNIQNVQRFTNTEFGELDVLQEGDKFWFPATQCARILGYSNPRDAIRLHCRNDGVVKHDAIAKRTNQYGTTTEIVNSINYITEGNLYRLICRSKLPAALSFETWVFDEVIPSIRKHGAYIVPELLDALNKNEAERQRLLDDLNADREVLNQLLGEKDVLQTAIDEARPKVNYYDSILQNPHTMPVTLIAKDYGYSAVRFNMLLRKLSIQYKVGKTWALYQDYADEGYVHYNVYRRGKKAISHMVWTQKGRLFLYNFLKKEGILPRIETEDQSESVRKDMNEE